VPYIHSVDPKECAKYRLSKSIRPNPIGSLVPSLDLSLSLNLDPFEYRHVLGTWYSNNVNPSQPTPPAPLVDFETYGLAHPGDDLTRIEDNDNLGERYSDREYDWSRHVGKYNIAPLFWDVIKRTFPAEQLLPSLNSVDLLNCE
jgi:hypothetical protein